MRLVCLRHKEIEKQIDEYKKLKRFQKQKESKQTLVPQVAIHQIMVKDEENDDDGHRS